MSERKLLEPYEFQKAIIERASKLRHFALFNDMGCLAGDTVIKVNWRRTAKKITIRRLHQLFHEGKTDIRVRSFKEDKGLIGLHDIQNVVSSGFKEVFRLELENGQHITATADHKFLTETGFKKLSELSLSDKIMIDTLKKHQKVEKRKPRVKPRYNLRKVGEFYPYGHYTTERGKRIKRAEVHRLTYEASLNGLSLESFIAFTFHKGYASKMSYVDPSLYHVHHKDHDSKNNALENLECLPKSTHQAYHGDYKHFGHASPEFSQVRSITPAGSTATYDIVCHDPYRNFVANGMVVHNSGKTLTVINIVKNKWIEHGGFIDTLVFCPIIVLQNWKEEFLLSTRLDPDLIGVCSGQDAKKKLKVINNPQKRVVIINYESLLNEQVRRALIERGFGIVIGDESHKLKNEKSKTFKAACEITKSCQHRYILSGTPYGNSVLDLWAQYYFLDRGETYGNDYQVFRGHYMEDENREWAQAEAANGVPHHLRKAFPKWVVRPYRMGEFNEKLKATSCRVTTEEAVDLPEFQNIPIKLELSHEQRERYNELRKHLITYVEGMEDNPLVVQNALPKLLRLNEICSGYMKLEDGTIYRFPVNPKLDAVLDLLSGMGEHRCIIFCIYQEDYKVIRDALEGAGIKFLEITGETSTEQKLLNAKAFQSTQGEEQVVLCNTKAAGIGANLIGAKYKIYFDRNYSLIDYLQSVKRNLRAGAIKHHEKLVDYHLIFPGTICEDTYKRVMKKRSEAAQALGDSLEIDFSKQDLLDILNAPM